MAGKNIRGKGNSIGFWQMLNNVLIASINKGQFPIAILGIVAIIGLVRMPPEDISKLFFRIFDGLEHYWLVGHILTVLAIVGWFIHARYQRRVINDEMRRVGRQRTDLQQKLMGSKLTSSEDGR